MAGDTGVALIVVDPEGRVFMLQEEETNLAHGKMAGQWSMPMETSREGEPDAEALQRLVAEEIANMAVWVEAEPFGSYQVMPDIEVRLYLGFLRSSFLPQGLWVRPYGGPLGNFILPPRSAETDGVSGHCWVPLGDATELWLRRGAWEMLRDCREGNSGVVRKRCRAATPLAKV